jgi:hypothetical protein
MSNNTSGLGFGQFVPGFEFLQKLVNPAAAASAPGGGSGMPNLGSWVAPTFNVEDLEKRIEELKAVQFWLEQNSKALSATIQAMEVQKMTLATLRDLNVSFGDFAKTGEAAAESASRSFAGFEMPGAQAPSPEPPPAPQPAAEPAPDQANDTAGATSKDKVDPVQWWGALQQQFQNIAVNAMQDLAKQNAPVPVKKAAPRKPAAKPAPAGKKAAARKKPAAAKKAPAKKAPARTRAR